jgi:hypothetical protein
MNRQRLILAVLFGVLVLAVGYSVIRFPRQKKIDKLTFTPGSGAAGAKGSVTAGEETRVRLDLLQRNQVGFTGFKKNIFNPIFHDLSKLPPVKPVTPAPPPPPPPVVAVPTESPVERELAQFTFLGFLEKEQRKTIFLSKNKEIFLVKKGERIAGKYEAVSITNEALTIRVLDGGTTEIIIPLFENQPLKAPRQHPTGTPPQPLPAGASPLPQQPGASLQMMQTPSGAVPQRQPPSRVSRRSGAEISPRPVGGGVPVTTEPGPAVE